MGSINPMWNKDITDIDGNNININSGKDYCNFFSLNIGDKDHLIYIEQAPAIIEALVKCMQFKDHDFHWNKLHKINRWLNRHGWGCLDNANTIIPKEELKAAVKEAESALVRLEKIKKFIKESDNELK